MREKKKFYLIILAIRSGDYYMYEYESDDEEVEEEEKPDEATVAQEQVYSSKKTKIKNMKILF